MRFYLLFFLCLLMTGVSAEFKGDYPREPIVLAGSLDVVDVFYCESALFKSIAGETGYLLNGFHGGISFRNRVTGNDATVEFGAKDGVFEALFGNVDNTTGDPVIVWKDAGTFGVYNSVNNSYWDRQTFVARIDGDTFNQFICAIPEDPPLYELFQVKVINAVTNETLQIIPSKTCVDFVWDRFQVLYDLGILLYDDPPLKRDFVSLVANQNVSYVDISVEDKTDVVDYYYSAQQLFESLSELGNKTLEEVFEEVYEFTQNGRIYIHQGGTRYMRIEPTYPFAEFSYAEGPLPSGSRRPVNQTDSQSGCPYEPPGSSSVVLSPPLVVLGILLTVLGCM